MNTNTLIDKIEAMISNLKNSSEESSSEDLYGYSLEEAYDKGFHDGSISKVEESIQQLEGILQELKQNS